MTYSPKEIMQYIDEEDVKFIRLAFCDVFGNQKNISIMADEVERAFDFGIAIDGSAIPGFSNGVHSDLLLHPDPSNIAVLPWRPDHGRVVRIFCNITYPDGTPFEPDLRKLLQTQIEEAEKMGITFSFGTEMEFYLFERDENGDPTRRTYDNAGYMDIAPEDKGENVRREICLTLEKMGIKPESSHHEEGPGQNEIDFRYADAMSAADNAVTFKSVVNTISARSGLFADFSPKPVSDKPGNGMHINISAKAASGEDIMEPVLAGILKYISDMTLFLNPSVDSYRRFGCDKAPLYISWSRENRSQLIRIPAAVGEYKRAELRSPDPMCNPYLAFALIIRAGLEGVKNDLKLPKAADINLYQAPAEVLKDFKSLPRNFDEAVSVAKASDFIFDTLPETIIDSYVNNRTKI